MKCIIQAKILSNLVDSIRDLVTCVNIDCNAEGFCIQCLDAAHVALCSFVIAKDGFESYECLRPTTLGLSLEAVRTVLKHVHGTVGLENMGNVLCISCTTAEKKCKFNLKLVDIDIEQFSIPVMEYQFVVQLSSKEFVCTCQSCFGDTTEITVGSHIQFTSKGDHGSSSVVYDGVLKQSGEISMEFASRYLSFFAKGASFSKAVVLSMSPGIPLRVEFGFESGHLQFYLAPKITED
jgi:proliferating cell nuclear antigen